MSETIAECDPSTIRDHLAWLVEPWATLGRDCVLELRSLGESVTPLSTHFWPDDLADAEGWAADVNSHVGRNLYVVCNPLNPDVRGRSARNTDVLGSILHWADADEPSAVESLRLWGGPRWSASVVTGATPHKRVHVYWRRADWCTDLAAWEATQRAIAAQFRSDPAVVNPARVMRLGGTITWPDAKKRARGYRSETATFKRRSDAAPVDGETFARLFSAARPEAPSGAAAFDTGPQALDRMATERLILTDAQWRPHVLKWIASSVARGWADDEIIFYACAKFTREGYSPAETAADVRPLIAWCRQQEAGKAKNFDFTSGTPERDAGTWRVQSAAEFIADFVAPEYLIDGVIQRGRLYTLTAPTGSGKTAAMLYASAAIASGWQFCGRETEQGAVLFLAGENPDDVRARVIATLDFYQIDPKRCPVYVIAGTFSLRADMERLREACAAIGDVALVVVDTFAAYFDGDDENSNAQALDFARVVRQLTQLASRPAVVMPAHPVKNAARTNLTPKGGSSLLNEVDGNLTLWNDEGRVRLHWQGKHRGPDFDPCQIELRLVENAKIHDRHGRLMPSVVAVPISEMRATEIAAETFTFEDRLLMQIEADPALSVAERCERLGLMTGGGKAHKSKLQRTLMRLRDQKLIRNFRGRWELTRDGEKAVEMARAGAAKAPDGGE